MQNYMNPLVSNFLRTNMNTRIIDTYLFFSLSYTHALCLKHERSIKKQENFVRNKENSTELLCCIGPPLWSEMSEISPMCFCRRIDWTCTQRRQSFRENGNKKRRHIFNTRKRQLKFLGDTTRKKGLENLTLTRQIEGKLTIWKLSIAYLRSLCK